MAQVFHGVGDFRDLEVWKWCRELRKDIETFCRRLPRQEQQRLGDQMIRAARSVTANLAEGFGRFHYLETIQSCRMARGSLSELLDHLQVAADNGYLRAAEFKAYETRVTSGIKLLNGFIRYLHKRQGGQGEGREREARGKVARWPRKNPRCPYCQRRLPRKLAHIWPTNDDQLPPSGQPINQSTGEP